MFLNISVICVPARFTYLWKYLLEFMKTKPFFTPHDFHLLTCQIYVQINIEGHFLSLERGLQIFDDLKSRFWGQEFAKSQILIMEIKNNNFTTSLMLSFIVWHLYSKCSFWESIYIYWYWQQDNKCFVTRKIRKMQMLSFTFEPIFIV